MAVKLEIVITQRFRFYIKIYQVTVKLLNQTKNRKLLANTTIPFGNHIGLCLFKCFPESDL